MEAKLHPSPEVPVPKRSIGDMEAFVIGVGELLPVGQPEAANSFYRYEIKRFKQAVDPLVFTQHVVSMQGQRVYHHSRSPQWI
eukprot:g2603.t1